MCDRLPEDERAACYARGCCCFGHTCTAEGCCAGEEREAKRRNYACPQMSMAFTLPSASLIGMTVYDFDSGVNGEYTEILGLSTYAYYVTPLRPSSGNDVQSRIAINTREYAAQWLEPATRRSAAALILRSRPAVDRYIFTSEAMDAPNPSDPQASAPPTSDDLP